MINSLERFKPYCADINEKENLQMGRYFNQRHVSIVAATVLYDLYTFVGVVFLQSYEPSAGD